MIEDQRPANIAKRQEDKIHIAHDERSLAEKINDRRLQDAVVHGDKWLGIAFVICTAIYGATMAFPDAFDPLFMDVTFFVAMASAFWLTMLGIGTGVLYKTNQRKGFAPVLAPDVVDPVDPLRAQKDAAAAVSGGGVPAMIGLIALFAVESVLLVLGIYLQGWWQYLLGAIGLVILSIALIYNINEVSIRSAVSQELERLAAQRADQYRDQAVPAQDMPQHKLNEAKRATKRLARKHQQLAILTVLDFGLAIATYFSCWAMYQSHVWSAPVSFFAFFTTAIWLVFLGNVTGYGGPGEHEHPMDMEDDDEDTPSICEILKGLKANKGSDAP